MPQVPFERFAFEGLFLLSYGCPLFQGILEESLQQYGSLIPIHVDDLVEKLQDIFSEGFSQSHRSETVVTVPSLFIYHLSFLDLKLFEI